MGSHGSVTLRAAVGNRFRAAPVGKRLFRVHPETLWRRFSTCVPPLERRCHNRFQNALLEPAQRGGQAPFCLGLLPTPRRFRRVKASVVLVARPVFLRTPIPEDRQIDLSDDILAGRQVPAIEGAGSGLDPPRVCVCSAASEPPREWTWEPSFSMMNPTRSP